MEPYNGKYYQLAEPINYPPPLSQPHPPILIGAFGEKKMLRLVAKYADVWNYVIGSPVEEFGVLNRKLEEEFEYLRRKLAVLRQHCNDVGRSFDEIEKTVVTYTKLTPDAQNENYVIDLCYELAKLGFQQVIFDIPNVSEITPLKILGKIIPYLYKL